MTVAPFSGGGSTRVARRRLAALTPTEARPGSPGRLGMWLAPRLAAADLDWPAGAAGRRGGATLAAAAVLVTAMAGPVAALLAIVLLVLGAGVALRSRRW